MVKVPSGVLPSPCLTLSPAGVTTVGKITDAKTGQPITGVVVGLISPRATAPETYISGNELLDHAKSDVTGAFTFLDGRVLRTWAKDGSAPA